MWQDKCGTCFNKIVISRHLATEEATKQNRRHKTRWKKKEFKSNTIENGKRQASEGKKYVARARSIEKKSKQKGIEWINKIAVI